MAYATILSQFISAALTLLLLSTSSEIYRLTWHDLHINREVLGNIITVGLPAGIQSVITAFSNTFVQAYINFFGSSCMAGWSCYNKLDQLVFLPMQSGGMAATAFVSQNIGAEQEERADKGTIRAIELTLAVTLGIILILIVFARQAVMLFTRDEEVIAFGVMFIRTNTIFLLCNCINHVHADQLCGDTADVSLCPDPVHLQHAQARGLQLSCGLDHLYAAGADLLLCAVGKGQENG